jgi:hypothetical protein
LLHLLTAAIGTKPTSRHDSQAVAIGGKADIAKTGGHVAFGPISDIGLHLMLQ